MRIVKTSALFILMLLCGRLALAVDYTYDALNRLTAVTYDDGAKIAYTYDAAGNRLTLAATPPTAGSTTTTTTQTSTTTTGVTTTSTASTTTTTIPGTGGASITLSTGWNLIGNGNNAALDVAATFGDTGKVTTVWKWIANSAKWAFYAPSLVGQALIDYATSKGYDVLSTINGGEGFWVNAKQSFTAQTPAGTAVLAADFQATGNKTLLQGWNLIAIGETKTAGEFNLALSATPPSPGTVPLNLITLWAWNAGQSNWYFYAPSLEAQGGTALTNYITSKGYLDFTTNNKTLGPGVGFWVNRP